MRMSVPQLEMQPFWPGADVPGAPVSDLDSVQKSALMPHWPCLFYRRVRSWNLAVAEAQRTYTARIEQTGIQARQSRARPRLDRSRLLRSADGIRNRRRHGRRARAQADELVRLHIPAALPAPRGCVEALDLGIREAVRRAKSRAVVAGLDVVRGAGSVRVGLRPEVGHRAGGAADVLAGHEGRAEGAAGVVDGEVVGGDAALGG